MSFCLWIERLPLSPGSDKSQAAVNGLDVTMSLAVQMIQALGGGTRRPRPGQPARPETGAAPPRSAVSRTFAPRAKRIIHLFMNGGPFGPDLFDPKPALQRSPGSGPQAVDLRTENGRPAG